jgi:hypothetical protein
VATVVPNWETTPDGTTTYEVLLTERALLRYADLRLWLGTAAATPATGGVPKVAIEAAGDFVQAAADKVWASATRTLTALGASLVQEIWDRATSALTTVGSIGKLIVDNLNATISSRASQTSADTIAGFLDTEIAAILALLDTEIAAIKAKTDLLPEGIKKNQALNNFVFLMVDANDHVTGKTGLSITATRSLDGGSFAACANAATEIASGLYKINLAASDLNADVVALRFTGTGADATIVKVKTSP